MRSKCAKKLTKYLNVGTKLRNLRNSKAGSDTVFDDYCECTNNCTFDTQCAFGHAKFGAHYKIEGGSADKYCEFIDCDIYAVDMDETCIVTSTTNRKELI